MRWRLTLHGVNRNALEAIYQLAGAIVFPWLIVNGVREGSKGITAVGTVFLSIFLLFRLHDWFWDYLPKWLFFLLVGGLAFGTLLLLRRLRLAERRQP